MQVLILLRRNISSDGGVPWDLKGFCGHSTGFTIVDDKSIYTRRSIFHETTIAYFTNDSRAKQKSLAMNNLIQYLDITLFVDMFYLSEEKMLIYSE